MAPDRVVDEVCRRVGLVRADAKSGVGPEPVKKDICHAAIVVEHDADLPWARLAEIDGGEGVNGNEGRLQSSIVPPREAGIDGGVVGAVNIGKPPRALRIVHGAVGGDRTAFALGDDETVRVLWPVAIDDQAGGIWPNKRRVEPHR